MADYRFTYLPEHLRCLAASTRIATEGIGSVFGCRRQVLQAQFAGFKGDARIVVSEDSILVEWTPSSSEQDPVVAAVLRLQRGESSPPS